MTTHYLPAFTVERVDGTQQTVCGQFIYPSEHTANPTCIGCATWLDHLEFTQEPAREQGRVIADISPSAPWGIARTA